MADADPQPGPSNATETPASSSGSVPDPTIRRPMLSDSLYAPGTFHGRSNEDADSFLDYVDRFAKYRHLSDENCLELLPVLLRDAACDFYDTLTPTQLESWTNFKRAFLDRFGRSKATRWQDASSLWSEGQQLTSPSTTS